MDNTYHKENLKEDLINKAIEIIFTEGVDKLSLRYLATKCNVSRQAPYNYFESKEAMLDSVRRYLAEEFAEKLEESIKDFNQDNPEVLNKMGYAYIDYFKNNPKYFNFMFGANNYKIIMTLDYVEDNFKPYDVLRSRCLHLAEVYHMPKNIALAGLVRCWSIVHGAASLVVNSNVSWNCDIDEMLSHLFDFGA